MHRDDLLTGTGDFNQRHPLLSTLINKQTTQPTPPRPPHAQLRALHAHSHALYQLVWAAASAPHDQGASGDHGQQAAARVVAGMLRAASELRQLDAALTQLVEAAAAHCGAAAAPAGTAAGTAAAVAGPAAAVAAAGPGGGRLGVQGPSSGRAGGQWEHVRAEGRDRATEHAAGAAAAVSLLSRPGILLAVREVVGQAPPGEPARVWKCM